MPHLPVLLEEAVAGLRPLAGGCYVDCTFGQGGHARAILERIGPGGRVLALDRDPSAVAEGRRLAERDARITVIKSSFAQLAEVVEAHGLSGSVHGVLFDLGVSSNQLDDPGRGFSFQADGPLDMRLDNETGPSAAEWIAASPEPEIARVIREYGEERHARRIARAIVRARARGPIETTARLAAVVAAACPTRERRKHPATRTFQALRIAVNRELEALEAALPQVPPLLVPGGRMVAISFHSLEDRIVKRFLRRSSRLPSGGPRHLPPPPAGEPPPLALVGRMTRASAGERERNPRARSAVMRIAEKRR